jgi:hypothetical protein
MFSQGNSESPYLLKRNHDNDNSSGGRKGKARPSPTARAIRRLHDIIRGVMSPDSIQDSNIFQLIHAHMKSLLSKDNKDTVCYIQNVIYVVRRELRDGTSLADGARIGAILPPTSPTCYDQQPVLS